MGTKTGEIIFEDRLRPRASVPYSLSRPLFPEGSYHLSMKRISEVLFLLLPALRHRPIRCGVALDCNPPLYA